jgi:hypothetical protein
MASTRAWMMVVVLSAGCSKYLPPLLTDGGTGGGAGGGAGGGSPRSGCLSDTECPAGMVCEGCSSGAFSCVPGCRSDSQCKPNHLCLGPVACASCPCPPGWCEVDPCLDLDNDGYVLSCDKNVVCGTKKLCDCNDQNPNVNPGRTEVCSNGLDDNCDGVPEWNDPACGYCPGGQNKCTSTFACKAIGSLTCSNGCCTECPSLAPPQCPTGKCLASGGLNPATGCNNAPFCVDCGVCPENVAPVCGVNGATYNNACNAQVANVLVLHDGACLSGENLSCNFFPVGSTAGCGTKGDMYCRDACPQCGGLGQNRCTKLGVCAWDGDCPAGKASLHCPDGGVALERCVDHACVADCK